ncbi:MAG: GspE/PulE family protein [Candidatus Sumerlaeia bacterium]
MADPIRKSLNKNEDAARAKPGKELVSKGGVPQAMDRQELQQYIQSLGNESAAHMQDDVIDTGLMSKDEILDAIAADMGMEKVVLGQIEFTPELIKQVPAYVAKKFGVLPVAYTDEEIELALSDPHNVQALDDLQRILGKTIRGRIAMQDDIERLIKRFYESDDVSQIYAGLTEGEEPQEANRWDEMTIGQGGDKEQAEQPAVVKFVDLIFRQAVYERASDIHIEPHRFGVTIRFRIDGVLHEVPSPPRKWQNAILSRLKVMSSMDLAEKRVPQDGRIRLNLPDKKLDLRVSSLPTIFGESIVMRILDQSQVMMGLQDVGFTERSVSIFKRLIKQPNGVILMTGPTGSGKTTTLYAALGSLNTPEEKLVTLEDPVEYMIPGINQIQINHEIGLNFAAGLRAVLRQSPDVILVGEIRDLETAENAIRAALTGHLVFSTLHTNDAPSSTIRLIDMGVKPYLVASSLQAAIAQRLVRRICGGCKTAYHPPAEAISEMGFDPDEYKDTDFFHGKGCERCNQGGYRGRTAIHEIMVMDPDLRRRVIRSESASRLKKAAVAKGMFTLRRDGWEKILKGQTTIEEVMRITAADEE